MSQKKTYEEKVSNEINKTGFVLEYEVTDAFSKAGWNLINNKYYLDDIHNVPREIDIVAYKVEEIFEVYVYTSLLISCKKNESDNWAFLVKALDKNDPNLNWKPIENTTSSKILRRMSKRLAWREDYLKYQCDDSKILFEPDAHVFAYQQLNKTSGKPQNDKQIYESISTLIKALAYEKDKRVDKRTFQKDTFYNFNLITIADTEMFKIDFTESPKSVSKINQQLYVNKFIVNGLEENKKVHLFTKEILSEMIDVYNKLHSSNCEYVKETIKLFYDKVFEQRFYYSVFLDEFADRLTSFMSFISINPVNLDAKGISFELKENKLKILFDIASGITLSEVKGSDDLKAHTRNLLFDYYEYTGEFDFDYEDELPF